MQRPLISALLFSLLCPVCTTAAVASLPGQEIEACATVTLQSESAIRSNTVITFVEPDSNQQTYFTLARSLFTGPSMVGKMVKLAGKIVQQQGGLYIDDGSISPVCVAVRSDLLSTQPNLGKFVTVTGACRREEDGTTSLLPFSDAAIQSVQ